MAYKYKTLNAIMKQEMKHGWFEVHCPKCKESRKVEPDGFFVCECGKKIESPMLVMGVI